MQVALYELLTEIEQLTSMIVCWGLLLSLQSRQSAILLPSSPQQSRGSMRHPNEILPAQASRSTASKETRRT